MNHRLVESVLRLNGAARPVEEARVLPPKNSSWGFYGTLMTASDHDTSKVNAQWAEAMTLLVKKYGFKPESARAALDSKYGRHFADQVGNNSSPTKELKKDQSFIRLFKKAAKEYEDDPRGYYESVDTRPTLEILDDEE